jgi:hypothetical protein
MMLIRTLSAMAIWAIWMVGGSQVVDACSCAGPIPISSDFEGSDAVFIGIIEQVAEMDDLTKENADGSMILGRSFAERVKFKVIKAFKGSLQEHLSIEGDGSNCDYDFSEGKKYLVYAYKGSGAWRTGKCSRTRLLTNASEDLRYIDYSLKKRPYGLLYGSILQKTTGPDGKPGLFMPRERLTIIVAASNGRHSATADESGSYQLILDPGEYKVLIERINGKSVSLPETIRVANGENKGIRLVIEEKQLKMISIK